MFSLASGRDPEIREVTCRRCGVINPVKIGTYTSGIKTLFCKGCGEEVQLIYNRTPVGLELKHSPERSLDEHQHGLRPR